MPIIRNPFRKPAGELPVQDNTRRNSAERTQTLSDTDVKLPVEYQLSEIDDSGVFIPPSPTETKSFWSTRSTASTSTSNHRSVFNESEPFNISRESFDSYRRSFDICARSPISEAIPTPPRQSLDSRRIYLPRTSLSLSRPSIDRPELQQVEEGFKEVDLNEDSSTANSNAKQPSKRRSLFARFGGVVDNNSSAANTEPQGGNNNNNSSSTSADGSRPGSSHHFGLSFAGRKRGQSGQGAELRSMSRLENQPPVMQAALPAEIKVDS